MTIAEGEPPPSRETRRHRGVPFALFCVFLIVRIVALDADPPSWLSWSAGIFTDEGIYAADARSVALTGHWAPGDFHSAIVAPLLHLIQLGVFKIFGVGLLQARLISVFFSLATLALFHEALCSKYDRRTALIGVTFLGLSVPYVLYNRLALLETPTLFVLVAAYLVWSKNGSKIAVGLLLGTAFVFKPLALLAAPAFVIAAWPDHRGVFQVLSGLAIAVLAYGLIWYLPHLATLTRMNHYYAFHQYLPHSWRGATHDLMRGMWTGDADGIIPYLIRHEFLLCALAVLSFFRMPVKHSDDRVLMVWFLTPLFAFLVVSYTPSRYFVLFWPPLAALAARGLADRPAHVVIGAICIFTISSLAQLFSLWPGRTYTVLDDGKNLPMSVAGRTIVVGQFAPELCLSNRLTCIYTQPGLANDDIISASGNHAGAMLVTRSPFWDTWRRERSQGAYGRKPVRTLAIGPKFVVDVYLSVPMNRVGRPKSRHETGFEPTNRYNNGSAIEATKHRRQSMKLQFLRNSLYAILADRLMPDVLFCERPRAHLARALLGARVGRGVRLRAGIDFGNDPTSISIGDECYVNRRCTFFADWGSAITIASNVWIGPEVMLWTGTHEVGPHRQRCGDGFTKPIVIEQGCWIGARVTVLAGVTIGPGCVVGAASLVNKDVPADSLIAGVPAKVLRRLPDATQERSANTVAADG